MKTSRVLLATSLVAVGGLLTACEQPAPGITVWSGTNSVRTDALCYAFDNPRLEPGTCAEEIVNGDDVGPAPELGVAPGTTVGISVDTSVAEEGWTVTVAGQELVQQPITESYFRFTFPNAQIPQDGLALQVLGGGQELRGVWAVRLVP